MSVLAATTFFATSNPPYGHGGGTLWQWRWKSGGGERFWFGKELSRRRKERERIGMATSRVQAGFFHTRTQPAGQDLRLGPDPFTKRVFFRGPNLPPQAPLSPTRSGPIPLPNKKKMPNTDFLSNQIVGDTQEYPNLNKLEILFFSLQNFPTSKVKTRINI